MKVTTKALVTIFVIALLTFSPISVSAETYGAAKSEERKLERIYQHHDRKLELRASVLGMSPDQLRSEIKINGIENVLRRHGFKSKQAFHIAVIGKVKDELRRRGWNEKKLDQLFNKRFERLVRNS